MDIPVIDFSRYNESETRLSVAEEIVRTLETVGFLYLKNHGIPADQVTKVNDAAKVYFEQDVSIKKQFLRPNVQFESPGSGYSEIGLERLDGLNVTEVKESFDMIPSHLPPDESASASVLIPPLVELYRSCVNLTNQINHCIALGLKLEDENFFIKNHKGMGNRDANSSLLRVLHYPAFDETQYGDAITRLGAHTDYGMVTILFQCDVGGLEVETLDNVYVAAPVIPDTVLINIGDLLQDWTGGRLKATRHRVQLQGGVSHTQVRRSIAFFAEPDYNTVVESLDPAKYLKPKAAKDHIFKRYRETHLFQQNIQILLS
ncbi:hypothetical protein RvY_07544 [Ramazzottius varieornatus]|uniref:Fe2OG dioxygenase domain-containing protein n=1 Tax=Ramazzottius varieornatus TaxID=947166 RepID=A0A1D1V2S7_RAMVA|nr:hypothetical protein RvY_07544 [Ramazzottius varieornatus]